jgi:SAM-dependent methyltransferase
MTFWCHTRAEFDTLTTSLDPYRMLVETQLLQTQETTGYCRACRKTTVFDTGPEPAPGEWKNLLEGMLCSSCGLNGRMRLCLQIVDEETLDHQVTSAAILERITPLYPYVAARLPGIVGCEFVGAEKHPGSLHKISGAIVRHENFMALSFAAASLDLLLHFDVLEHVPDARSALQQAFRVLKPGGKMIFSCPFYHNLPHNLVRAIVENGAVRHLLPPCYHGNPMSGQGSLVYIHPTWDIMDWLRDTGFTDVRIGLSYNPTEGTVSNGSPYEDGHTWPVVLVAVK